MKQVEVIYKFVLTEDGPVHGFMTLKTGDKEEIEAWLKDHSNSDPEYNERVYEVSVSSVKVTGTGHDGEESTVTVEVCGEIDGRDVIENFHIQTTEGKYNSFMGCWILTDHSGKDCDFSRDEQLLFDVADAIEVAEDFLK